MYKRGDATIMGIVVIVILIAVIVGLAKIASPTQTTTNALPTRTISRGAVTSPVVITEYADFQCPACKTVLPMIGALYKEFGNQVQFVFRQFPLRSIHVNGDIAARTAEAAYNQGKFWEMFEKLYGNQEVWSIEANPQTTFEKYAEELGMNVAVFKNDLISKEVVLTIDADINEAKKLKINGTPTFAINGEKIAPESAEEFRNLVVAALAKAGVYSSSTPATATTTVTQ